MAAHPPLDFLSAAVFSAVLVAAALLTYRRPSWGVAALVFVDPFAWYHYVAQTTTITLPKAILVGAVVGLIIRRASLAPLWSPQARPLLIGALALVAANALSIVPALHIGAAVRETLKAVEYLLTFAVCAVAIAEDPDLGPFRAALFASVTIVTLAALAQEFTGTPSGMWIAGHIVPRIAGPLEGPNQLSGYLGLTIPILLALALMTRDRLAAALSAGAFLALVLTLSRAGIASTVLAIGLLLMFGRITDLRAIASVVGGMFATILAGVSALGALGHEASFNNPGAPTDVATREQLWPAAIELWKRSPLLGVGAGNYELDLPAVGLTAAHTHANSLYLQALVEGGIPLLAATLWTVYASVATFTRARSRDPIVIGILAGSCGLAIHQVVDLLTFFPKVGGLWWMLLGIGVGRLIAARTVVNA